VDFGLSGLSGFLSFPTLKEANPSAQGTALCLKNGRVRRNRRVRLQRKEEILRKFA